MQVYILFFSSKLQQKKNELGLRVLNYNYYSAFSMEDPTSTHSKVTNKFGAKLPIDHKIKSCASRFVDVVNFVPK